MNPLKYRDIAKEAADKLGASTELVTDISLMFWKALRDELSSATHPHVNVPKLGVFYVKPWSLKTKIEQEVKKTRYFVDANQEITIRGYAIKKAREEKLKALKELEEKMLLLDIEKHELKQYRKDLEDESN